MRVVPRERRSVEHRERDGVDVAAAVGQVAARVHVHGLAGADGIGLGQVRSPQDVSGLRVDDREGQEVRIDPRGGLPRHPRSSLRGEQHQRGRVIRLRCEGVGSGSSPGRIDGVGRAEVGKGYGGPEIVYGRAGDVDQPAVVRDVGLQPVPEDRHPAGALRPRDVMGAHDVDVVLPQMERPQVGPVQPERPQVRIHVVHRHLRRRPVARSGEEPVEPADHPERARLGVGDHDAFTAELPGERRPRPEHRSTGCDGRS